MNIKEKTLCMLLAECFEHHNVLCIPEDVTTDDSQKDAGNNNKFKRGRSSYE